MESPYVSLNVAQNNQQREDVDLVCACMHRQLYQTVTSHPLTHTLAHTHLSPVRRYLGRLVTNIYIVRALSLTRPWSYSKLQQKTRVKARKGNKMRFCHTQSQFGEFFWENEA